MLQQCIPILPDRFVLRLQSHRSLKTLQGFLQLPYSVQGGTQIKMGLSSVRLHLGDAAEQGQGLSKPFSIKVQHRQLAHCILIVCLQFQHPAERSLRFLQPLLLQHDDAQIIRDFCSQVAAAQGRVDPRILLQAQGHGLVQ